MVEKAQYHTLPQLERRQGGGRTDRARGAPTGRGARRQVEGRAAGAGGAPLGRAARRQERRQ